MKTKEGLTKNEQDLLAIEKYLAGDSNAFTFIFNRYRPFAYARALSFLRIEADAEEAAMDAMTKVFKNLDSFSPKYTFNSWITTIIRNSVTDFHRKKITYGKYNTVSIDNQNSSDNIKDDSHGVVYNLSSNERNPEQKLIQDEDNNTLMKAIEMLDDGSKTGKLYKKALELIYIKDKTYAEVAEILDIKITSLKPSVGRAKARAKNNFTKLMFGRIQ